MTLTVRCAGLTEMAAGIEEKRSEHQRRDAWRTRLSTLQRALPQRILDAVDEAVQVRHSRPPLSEYVKEVGGELNFLRSLRMQCRAMQRERGEIGVQHREDDEDAKVDDFKGSLPMSHARYTIHVRVHLHHAHVNVLVFTSTARHSNSAKRALYVY